MNDIYTFIKLLKEYRIVIPVMQRSYAEGRNTKHAEDVRKSIIETIINSVQNNKPLFFDFVYGNINKEEKKFIPLHPNGPTSHNYNVPTTFLGRA